MGRVHRSALSLGFFGDDLEPDQITQMLECQPEVGVRKGGTWLTSRGVPKVARTGSWRISAARAEPADPDAQLHSLLDRMSHDLDAWRALASRFRGRIFCGLFLSEGNQGVMFGQPALQAMAERGLMLDLDIYGHESD